MSEPLRVLVVDDSEGDTQLLLAELRRAGLAPVHERVETAEELTAALVGTSWDVVLSDLTLPRLDAPRALELVQASGLDLPFIVVSGTEGVDVAVETMQRRADDYLRKGDLSRLGEAIRRELRAAEARHARRRAEEKIEHLNRVVRGIRNVNQLIVRERDPARLIQRACDLTVEARGFESCCIVLHDGSRLGAHAVAGEASSQAALRRALATGELPDCLRRVLSESSVVVRLDPAHTCGDCPVNADHSPARDAIAVRLAHEGTTYGALLVSLPQGLGNDDDELGLLQEVAGDIAFALRGIALEADHRRAMKSLRLSAAQWSATFDAISDIVCVLSPDHEILELNQAGCRSLGVSAEELVGRKCFGLVHGSDSPIAQCPCAEAARTLTPATSLHEQNGRAFELNAWPVLDADGRLEALVHIVKDVTEVKTTEVALQRSERQYRALVEDLEDVVFSLDDKGRFRFVSSAIRKFGFAPDDLLGRPFADFVHPDDLQGLAESFLRTLAGAAEPYEFRAMDKEGEIHFMRSSSRALREPGEPVTVTGLLMDVTRQKGMEEQLRMAQKMEAVGQLAGGIAHDFNNLLTVINSYAAFAMAALGETDPIRADVAEIKQAGDRAALLTRQLLAFSRRQIFQPEVLDINGVVTNLEKMLRRILGEDIDMVVRLAPDLGRVLADPGQMEQVIMNLAINSRDAMPRGGKLTIETADVSLDEEYARSHVSVTPGPYVQLSVTDDGHGMDPATRDRIFEPFFTTKEKGKGTGLGMSTVYGIVKQSGGNIWVYSEQGQGTTFKIYLPRVDAPPAASRRPVTRSTYTGEETVLVVEDEDAVREVTRRILSAAGYTVLTASSGPEALRVCEQHTGAIHLVLTDVVMPQMSGKDFTEQLAKLCPEIRVLYMSGYTDNAIVHHGVLASGTKFISKPFSATDLTRKVRQVLHSE